MCLGVYVSGVSIAERGSDTKTLRHLDTFSDREQYLAITATVLTNLRKMARHLVASMPVFPGADMKADGQSQIIAKSAFNVDPLDLSFAECNAAFGEIVG